MHNVKSLSRLWGNIDYVCDGGAEKLDMALESFREIEGNGGLEISGEAQDIRSAFRDKVKTYISDISAKDQSAAEARAENTIGVPLYPVATLGRALP